VTEHVRDARVVAERAGPEARKAAVVPNGCLKRAFPRRLADRELDRPPVGLSLVAVATPKDRDRAPHVA